MPTAYRLCSRRLRPMRERGSSSACRCMPMTSSARRCATTKSRRLSSLASTALMPSGSSMRLPISRWRSSSQEGPRRSPSLYRPGAMLRTPLTVFSSTGHVAADAAEALAQQAEGALLRLLLVQAEDVADLPERGGVDAVRQRARVAVDAAVGAVAGGDGAQKALRRAVAAGLRVGAGGEEAAVVVGAAGERLAPGGLAVRRDALALGHLLELLLREPPGDGAQQAVGPARARPVAPLEHVEEQQHALHGVRREAAAHVEERVREVVRHAPPRAGTPPGRGRSRAPRRPPRTWPRRCPAPPRARAARPRGTTCRARS